MKKLLCLLMAIACLFCISCGEDQLFGCEGCDDDIDDMVANRGAADEVDVYSSGDYWSGTYWYWCSGIAYTFTQSDCSCEVSTYTFSPICY